MGKLGRISPKNVSIYTIYEIYTHKYNTKIYIQKTNKVNTVIRSYYRKKLAEVVFLLGRS